jgi:hypothetical protein
MSVVSKAAPCASKVALVLSTSAALVTKSAIVILIAIAVI